MQSDSKQTIGNQHTKYTIKPRPASAGPLHAQRVNELFCSGLLESYSKGMVGLDRILTQPRPPFEITGKVVFKTTQTWYMRTRD